MVSMYKRSKVDTIGGPVHLVTIPEGNECDAHEEGVPHVRPQQDQNVKKDEVAADLENPSTDEPSDPTPLHQRNWIRWTTG